MDDRSPMEPLQDAPETSGAELSSNCGAESERDQAAKQEFLWRTHDYLNEYARFADTKAAFAGTLSGAFLGFLYSAKAFRPIVNTHILQWTIPVWLAALAGTSLCVSLGLAIWTIRPRLRTTQATGYMYWASIAAHSSLESLRASFHGESAQTLNDHLLKHLYDISKLVCVPKYRAVSVCMLMLLLGALLGAASLLLGGLGQ